MRIRWETGETPIVAPGSLFHCANSVKSFFADDPENLGNNNSEKSLYILSYPICSFVDINPHKEDKGRIEL